MNVLDGDDSLPSDSENDGVFEDYEEDDDELEDDDDLMGEPDAVRSFKPHHRSA
jgi:hypothetical protein